MKVNHFILLSLLCKALFGLALTQKSGAVFFSNALSLGLNFESKTLGPRYPESNLIPFSTDSLKSILVIKIARANVGQPVSGLKITLQDETSGESRSLGYDPTTMTARALVDSTHRYTVAIDAPGYTPYRKYIARVEPNQEIGIQLTRADAKPDGKKYLLIVLDKEQRSVVPGAEVRVLDERKNPVEVTKSAGQYTVFLPEIGKFTYVVEARQYQTARGVIERPVTGVVEIGLLRRNSAPETQTIAFVAQDAFTRKTISARFRLNGPETNTSPTFTTAANPEFGTELKLKQPYLLEVESEGYTNYSASITLDDPETEPIKPRIVLLEPMAYEVNFTVLDAVSMKPIDPASFKIGETGKNVNLQSAGNLRKVLLAPGKQYDLRVGQPGYELFERTLTFEKPTSPRDLLKSILLAPVKAEAKPTPAATTTTITPPAVAKEDKTVFENLKVGEAVRLDNVYFDQSSYLLRTESYPQLDKLVNTLKVNSKLKIEIAGHTDNVGDARLNKYLSENRARVISSYLTNRGIAKNRLIPKGYGQTKPVAPNDTEENKAQNRRVEFVVLEN